MSAPPRSLGRRLARPLTILGRVALAALFAAAAVPKLLDPAAFATAIDNYRVLPESLVVVLAVLVPSFELVVAAGLLWGRFARGALLLSTLMFAVFAVAMGQAHARGIDLECGCFGASLQTAVSWWTVARNVALGLVAGLLFVAAGRQQTSDKPMAPDGQPS